MRTLFEAVRSAGVGFICGVPDSTLSTFAQEAEGDGTIPVLTAACEGSAVSLAAGHWAGTDAFPCVYLQNSGLANALSPLLSLVSAEVFDIPMLLVVGWRGEPGQADEPQHRATGRATEELLRLAGFDVLIVREHTSDALRQVHGRVLACRAQQGRLALLVPPFAPSVQVDAAAEDTRRQIDKMAALGLLLDGLPPDTIIVAGTGHTGRELLKIRAQQGGHGSRDIVFPGAMGFASHFAIGLALGSGQRVLCLDGDGAFLMHGCGTAIVRHATGAAFTHVLFDNGAHVSVGGHAVCGNGAVDYVGLAAALGYRQALSVDSLDELRIFLQASGQQTGGVFVRVPVASATEPKLPRPTEPLSQMLRRVANSIGHTA